MPTKKVINARPKGKRSTGKKVSEMINYTCFKCKVQKRETEFYKSNSTVYEKIPVCKECVSQVYEYYLNKYIDPDVAIIKICRMFDVYYNKDLLQTFKDKNTEASLLTLYFRSVNSLIQYRNFTFDDSDLENTESTTEKMIDSLHDKKDIEFWGKGYPPCDYEFLNTCFDRWIKTHKHDTESELVCLREICKIELEKEKNRQMNKSDVKLNRELLVWMSAAQAASKNTDTSKDLGSFGEYIKRIEKTRPAEWFQDKALYQDFDGLKQYLLDFTFRPLKNLLIGSKDFDIKDSDPIFKEVNGE